MRLKGEARQKTLRQSHSKVKVMLIVFFDYHGVVHYEFLQAGQKVNKYYYLRSLLLWHEVIWVEHPEMWKENS